MTGYLHVEVVMPWEVSVQNEFFNLVVFCIEQNILETNDVSVVRGRRQERGNLTIPNVK